MSGARLGIVSSIRETDKALLVMDEEGIETWLPKSQIHDDSEVWKVNQKGELIVSQWYAEQKGWA